MMRLELVIIPLLLLAMAACMGQPQADAGAPEDVKIESAENASDAITDISSEVDDLTGILDDLDSSLT